MHTFYIIFSGGLSISLYAEKYCKELSDVVFYTGNQVVERFPATEVVAIQQEQEAVPVAPAVMHEDPVCF